MLEQGQRQHGLPRRAEIRRLVRMWQLLDGVLGKDGPYLLGRDLSAIDMFLVMLAHWSREMKKPAHRYPHLGRLMELIEARPAYRRMMTEEGNS